MASTLSAVVAITTGNHSSWPRVSSEDQRIRRAVEEHQKGRLDDAGLARVEDEVTRDVVAEQVAVGVEIVTDGQIRWCDPVSHMLRDAEGVRINGLLRWYDTNFYFRQPRIEALPRRTGDSRVEEWRRAQEVSPKPVQAVVTGAYTMARLSQCGPPFARVFEALAGYVAEEVRALARSGARRIQIEEPEVLRHPGDVRLVLEAVARAAAEKGAATLVLVTYFGDATPIAERLLDSAADVVGFDLTYAEALWDRLRRDGKPVQLGAVDARNTRADDLEALARRIAPIAAARDVHLTPSAGLEHLPRGAARRKLASVARLKEMLR